MEGSVSNEESSQSFSRDERIRFNSAIIANNDDKELLQVSSKSSNVHEIHPQEKHRVDSELGTEEKLSSHEVRADSLSLPVGEGEVRAAGHGNHRQHATSHKLIGPGAGDSSGAIDLQGSIEYSAGPPLKPPAAAGGITPPTARPPTDWTSPLSSFGDLQSGKAASATRTPPKCSTACGAASTSSTAGLAISAGGAERGCGAVAPGTIIKFEISCRSRICIFIIR